VTRHAQRQREIGHLFNLGQPTNSARLNLPYRPAVCRVQSADLPAATCANMAETRH
jgi:hypothetical protein